MYHLNYYQAEFIPLLNMCCDMKLCSKVRARWEGVEGSLIPVLLSKVAGVWPERERASLQAAIMGKWSSSSQEIRTLFSLLLNFLLCPIQFKLEFKLCGRLLISYRSTILKGFWHKLESYPKQRIWFFNLEFFWTLFPSFCSIICALHQIKAVCIMQRACYE